jgi:uncharacterized membrane protein YcaP (DUF421 family)
MPGWLISHDMGKLLFTLGAPVAEKMIRPVIVYIALVVLVRIFGKRELAQLNPFDLVVLLVLSETVQNAMIGEDNSITGALIGAFSLLAVNYLVVRFLFRHRRLERAVEGEPTVLIRDGRIDRKALEKEVLTESELEDALAEQGVDNVGDVQKCTLEPGGSFHVVRKQPPRDEAHYEELRRGIEELRGKLDLLLARRAG